NARHLAVHQHRGADDLAAEGVADPLVAQADAEHRRAPPELADDVHRDAGVFGPPRARRNHDAIRLHRFDLAERDLVVAAHGRRRSQLAQVLRQGVGKRVVVVDEENRHSSVSAISMACSRARALSRVSSYSAAGFESATMPATAWMRATPPRVVLVRGG